MPESYDFLYKIISMASVLSVRTIQACLGSSCSSAQDPSIPIPMDIMEPPDPLLFVTSQRASAPGASVVGHTATSLQATSLKLIAWNMSRSLAGCYTGKPVSSVSMTGLSECQEPVVY